MQFLRNSVSARTCYQPMLGRGDQVHGRRKIEDSLQVRSSYGAEVDVHRMKTHAGQSIVDDHTGAHDALQTAQETCDEWRDTN